MMDIPQLLWGHHRGRHRNHQVKIGPCIGLTINILKVTDFTEFGEAMGGIC